MKPKSCLLYIRPLYYLCTILAMVPPCKFGKVPAAPSLLFKLFTVAHIVVIIGCYVHSNEGRATYLYNSTDLVITITDKMSNLALTFFNVICRIATVFLNGRLMHNFMYNAYRISMKDEFYGFSATAFNVQFVIFNLYMACIIGMDAWVWLSSVGWHVFQFYVARSAEYYMCNLTMFFLFHFAYVVKHQFRSLSKSLEIAIRVLCWKQNCLFMIDCRPLKTQQSTKYTDLKSIGKCYNYICNLVEMYNDMFGFIILAAVLVIIVYTLNLINIFLVFVMQKSKGLDGVEFGFELMVVCGLWIFTFLLFSSLLAWCCNGVMCESGKFPIICYVWLNKVPTISKIAEERALREDLMLLAQQTTARQPRFSAFGFFNVDYSLLGFVLGSVTSYVIVSIQFIK